MECVALCSVWFDKLRVRAVNHMSQANKRALAFEALQSLFLFIYSLMIQKYPSMSFTVALTTAFLLVCKKLII
jgi:hypothetical protein